jgi:hypothetical protein
MLSAIVDLSSQILSLIPARSRRVEERTDGGADKVLKLMEKRHL